MTIDIEQIKDANPIEDIIAQDYRLPQHGRYRKAPKAGGLVVDVNRQMYHWFAGPRGLEHGDVIHWLTRQKGMEFQQAVEWLCARAGLPAPVWGGDERAHLAAVARAEALGVAARVFAKWFWQSPDAQAYAARRGWSLEREDDHSETATGGTAVRAMLGYSGEGSDAQREEMRREMLAAGVDVDSPAAVSVLGMRGGVREWAQFHNLVLPDNWIADGYIPSMIGRGGLVYPHIRAGRVVYLTRRGIAEKMHYNLPASLIGRKQPYYNHVYSSGADQVVIVEGQADAVTLGQWGVAAVALAGVHGGDEGAQALAEIAERLGKSHKVLYVGLDADDAGRGSAWRIADVLGPLCRLITWPGINWEESGEEKTVKDANDYLRALIARGAQEGKQREELLRLLKDAPAYVESVAGWAGHLAGAARDEGIRKALDVISRMEELDLSQYRAGLAKSLGIGVRELSHMLRTYKEKAKEKGSPEGEPIYTWGGAVGGWLLEYLYNGEDHTAGLAWRDPNGTIGSGPSVMIDGARYAPWPPNETLKMGAVLMPSDVGPKKPIRDLVMEIEMYLRSVYILPSDKLARLVAYWVISTWMYDSFDALIYLRLFGDTGSGKSELMFRIGLVCYRSMSSSGASSPSSLFRMVQRYQGTVMIDEADLVQSDTAQDIIKFYNLGAMRGRPIWRTTEVMLADGTRGFEEIPFQTYCPKLMTIKREMRDDAVGSRSLTIKLQPRETPELVAAGIPLNITDEMRGRAQALRNRLLRYRLENWQPSIEIDPSFYEMSVSARLNQVAGCLMAMAKDDAEQLEDIRRNLRDYYRETLLDRSMSLTARVIEAMFKIMKYPDLHKRMVREEADGTLAVKIGDVTQIANEILDEMNDTNDEDDSPKKKERDGLKPKTIGRILREELQMAVSERRRDGFWVFWNEPRMLGAAQRYGVDPAEIGPEQPKGKQTAEARAAEAKAVEIWAQRAEAEE